MFTRDMVSCSVVLGLGVVLALMMLWRSAPRSWAEMKADVVTYCETHEETAACRRFLSERGAR